MKDLQRRQAKSLPEVLGCLDRHAKDEPRIAGPRQRIVDAVKRIAELKETQRLATGQLDLDDRQLGPIRQRLRDDHLIPLARQGKEILQMEAGARAALKVPVTSATNDAHVAAGDRFAEFIAPHAAAFLGEGNRADFLDGLRAATDALRVRASQNGEATRRRAAATAELRKAVPAARRQVMVIDGIIRARLRTDYKFAHEWERAKRVDKPMGRPKARGKKKKKK